MTKKERSDYNKEYYKKNKNTDVERKRKVSKEWRVKNKAKISAQSKEYAKGYKERRKTQDRPYV